MDLDLDFDAAPDCFDDASRDDACDCGECRACIETAVRDARGNDEAQS